MSLTPASTVLFAIGPLLAGVVLQLFFARLISARAKGVLALLTCLPSLVAVLAAYPAIAARAVDVHLSPWDGPLSLAFHVDALSLMFALMGTGIGAIVLLYSIDYMKRDVAATRFYALMLTFIGGLVGLVCSADLLLFYFWWEVIGLCSFGLVGFWYRDPEAVSGARKVLLMTHLAGYGLLAAVLAVYARTGTTLWTDPAVAHAFTGGLFVLMLVAAVAKSVQLPLHTWIPEAMAAPTPVSALLHAACYVKAGVYLVARMHSFAAWPMPWSATVMWIGTVTMVVGVMYAMVQNDIKRMLAFHTVSQIGYMITGLGLGTPLGITAGLLHCLNHGFFKGGLFLTAGSVQHATGTRDMNELGGLGSRMPRTFTFWLISVGSMVGVPLMSGFVSKWLLFTAALEQRQIVPAVVAWVVSVGTVFSCAKVTNCVFLGSTNARTEQAHESPVSMRWGMGLIATGSILLGVAPQVAIQFVLNPVLAALGLPAVVGVSWFGLTTAAGAWWLTGGFVLAVVSVVLGAIVFLALGLAPTAFASGALAGAGGGVFTGGEPLPGSGRFPASDFSIVIKKEWKAFFAHVDVDQYYLAVWRGILALAKPAGRWLSFLESRASAWTVILAAIAVIAVRYLPATPVGMSFAPRGTLSPLLTVSCGVAALALCLAAFSTRKWRGLVPFMLAAGILAVAGMATYSAALRVVLLEAASLTALLLVWRVSESRSASWAYLTAVVLSAGAIAGGEYALAVSAAEWGRALLLVGFLLKLAIVPLFLWLPAVAEAVPSVVVGLIVSVVDIAAFSEFLSITSSHPWLLTPPGIWIGLAALTALTGALLMLSQRNLKRLLALSTVEDLGFLLLGVASLTEFGTSGVVFGVAAHALAKALLFSSLSRPEGDGALDQNARGLASRYPLSAAAFLLGMLAVLGIPPTLGYTGRWRLYESALHAGPVVLLAFLLSSALALIAYARALTEFWWGPAKEADANKGQREPLWLAVAFLPPALGLVAFGIFPHLVATILRGAR